MIGTGEPVRSPTIGRVTGKRQVDVEGATAQSWRSRALSGAYRTVAIDAVRDALDFTRADLPGSGLRLVEVLREPVAHALPVEQVLGHALADVRLRAGAAVA